MQGEECGHIDGDFIIALAHLVAYGNMGLGMTAKSFGWPGMSYAQNVASLTSLTVSNFGIALPFSVAAWSTQTRRCREYLSMSG